MLWRIFIDSIFLTHMAVDLFFTESNIGLTGEKQEHFDIFIRTELGEIINFPYLGWLASDLMESQKQSRYHQTLEYVLAVARTEELDFTGDLVIEERNGKKVMVGKNIVFLLQDVLGGNGLNNYGNR